MIQGLANEFNQIFDKFPVSEATLEYRDHLISAIMAAPPQSAHDVIAKLEAAIGYLGLEHAEDLEDAVARDAMMAAISFLKKDA